MQSGAGRGAGWRATAGFGVCVAWQGHRPGGWVRQTLPKAATGRGCGWSLGTAGLTEKELAQARVSTAESVRAVRSDAMVLIHKVRCRSPKLLQDVASGR